MWENTTWSRMAHNELDDRVILLSPEVLSRPILAVDDLSRQQLFTVPMKQAVWYTYGWLKVGSYNSYIRQENRANTEQPQNM